jgi:hypothetical protein
MRLRACIGGLLLGATACAGLPETVRVNVDGRTVEISQRGLSGRLPGGWSTSPDCGMGSRFDVAELGTSAVSIRMITRDEIELVGGDGSAVRLYRCQ